MKIKRKTLIIIILAIIVIILTVVSILLITKQNESKYPGNPVTFSSLSETSKDVDVKQLGDIKSKNISLYSTIPSNGSITADEIIKGMGISFLDRDIRGTDPKIWDNGKDFFRYYGITNTLIFQLGNGIKFEKTDTVFDEFFNKYLGVIYDFDIVEEENTSSGGIKIYGRRVIEDIPIEIGFGDEYTDYLEFNKNGYLIAGKILLSEFQNEGVYIPTVSNSYLKDLINNDIYPKEIYLKTSILSNSIELNYLDDAWGDIVDSANNCQGTEQEIVFIYKNVKQKYLVPIFKISGDCEVEYEDTIYNVPSTFYVLAADPKYIVKE